MAESNRNTLPEQSGPWPTSDNTNDTLSTSEGHDIPPVILTPMPDTEGNVSLPSYKDQARSYVVPVNNNNNNNNNRHDHGVISTITMSTTMEVPPTQVAYGTTGSSSTNKVDGESPATSRTATGNSVIPLAQAIAYPADSNNSSETFDVVNGVVVITESRHLTGTTVNDLTTSTATATAAAAAAHYPPTVPPKRHNNNTGRNTNLDDDDRRSKRCGGFLFGATNENGSVRWTWLVIGIMCTSIVIAVAVVMSVLCGDGNCSGGGGSPPPKQIPPSKDDDTNNSTSETTLPYFLEDDLPTLQRAVDEYYTAIVALEENTTTNMEEILQNEPVIRQYGYPISTWDVSRVTNFTSVFDGKRNTQLSLIFNENLSSWNVASSIDMFRMFSKLNVYEGMGLETWDVSNVVNMRSMFHESHAFRGNVSHWQVQKVKSMTRLFSDCHVFDTDISSWTTSTSESMAWMFFDARIFNQDISNWDVRKVKDFSEMFQKTREFNQNISGWDVSSGEDMQSMFDGAVAFNQDLSTWDVRNNVNFYNMFANTQSFNHSLCTWGLNLRASTNVTGMFNGSTSCIRSSDPTSSDSLFLSAGPFCHPCAY